MFEFINKKKGMDAVKRTIINEMRKLRDAFNSHTDLNESILCMDALRGATRKMIAYTGYQSSDNFNGKDHTVIFALVKLFTTGNVILNIKREPKQAEAVQRILQFYKLDYQMKDTSVKEMKRLRINS